jgi:hypothetical protein
MSKLLLKTTPPKLLVYTMGRSGSNEDCSSTSFSSFFVLLPFIFLRGPPPCFGSVRNEQPEMMNLKVGFRRVYIVLHVCWIIGGLSLYLLDWPGEHEPEVDTWNENIAACQSHAQSYENEEHLNNLSRLGRRLPEVVLNFGRDEGGLQITTLKDALKECDHRYPFPTFGSWHYVFQGLRHAPPTYRLILASVLFLAPNVRLSTAVRPHLGSRF